MSKNVTREVHSNCEIVEISNGQMKVRWGVGLTEFEFIRYNSLYGHKVGDKGRMLYVVHGNMAYHSFVKDN